MRKILITLFAILSLNIGNAQAAITQLLWNSEMQATWDAEKLANSAIYQRLISEVDGNTCTTNEFGIRQAIAYKVTGNTAYATAAYNKFSGLLSTSTSPDNVREYGVPTVIAFSMVADALSAGQISNLIGDFAAYHDKVLSVSNLMSDSDQVVGSLMAYYMMAIAQEDDNPGTLADWLDDVATNGKPIGGIDSTGNNTSTYRNTITRFCQTLSTGGDWIESSHYNPGTLRLLFMGIEGVNQYYGTDKFPECTALYDDFAFHTYQKLTPDYSEPFHWGDVESQSVRSFNISSTLRFYDMMAFLAPNDANLYHFFDDKYSTSACYLGGEHYMFYKPSSEVARAKDSGVTSSNASRVGTSYWHSGWSNSDTFFATFFAGKLGVDHEMDAVSNFALRRNGKWVINFMQGYYGHPYQDSPYYNNLLINGAFTGMYEAKGQTQYEYGSNYMLTGGLTGGLYHKNGTDDPSPVFVKEYNRQILLLHNTDSSDTIVIQDRLDACNPSSTSCMTAYKYSRLPHPTNDLYRRRVTGAGAKHEWLINTFTSPSCGGSLCSWTAADGNTVYLNVGIPNYTTDILTLGPGSSIGTNVSPYYFIDNNGSTTIHKSSEGKFQLRLLYAPLTNSYEFNDWINVLHTGSSNPTVTSITDGAGSEDAKGVLIDLSGQKKLVMFNDTRDTTTTFTSTINGPPNGFSAGYDSARFTKTAAMRLFKLGSNAVFTTSDNENVIVYIVGLDPSKSWTVTKDGSDAGCTVSSQGLCTFTFVQTAGTHTVAWSVGAGGGGPTCNDNCQICADSVECADSVLICYYHNNDGATPDGCWDYQEQSVLCAADPNECPSATLCADAGYCWTGTNCVTECAVPPEGDTVTLTATEDMYIRGGTNIDGTSGLQQQLTNFDARGLAVKSSTNDVNFSRVACTKFDTSEGTSGIDPEGQVNNVALKLKVSSAGNLSGVVRVYECLRDWEETTATWLTYDGTNNWNTAGARGNGTDITGNWNTSSGALAFYNIGGAEQVGDTVTFSDSGLTTYVQEHLGETINLCIQQQATAGGSNFFTYDSENATSSNKPQMEVTYVNPETTPEISSPGTTRQFGGGTVRGARVGQ